MTDSTLGIVVVNYGASELMGRNLTRIDLASVPARVVVVDNFSTAAERVAITALCTRYGWDLVQSLRNDGFGAGCNAGAARAAELGCDSFLFLNPDAWLTTEATAQLHQLGAAHPRSLIAPIITRPDGSVWFRGSELDANSGRVRAVRGDFVSGPDSWLTGACVLAPAAMWSEIGGFDDAYFLYWEDIDLSRRCVELGGELIVAGNISAVHEVGGTQSEADSGPAKSSAYYYYNCRNRLLFGSQHLPTSQLLRWLVRTPAQSAAILLRGGRRQFVSSPGLLLAGVRGSVVGIGLVLRELARRSARSQKWFRR